MARLTNSELLGKYRRQLSGFWRVNRRATIAAVAALVVLVVGWLGLDLLQGNLAESEHREVNMTASWLSKDVRATLDKQLAAVDEQVDPAALAQLLSDGDEEVLRAQESALTQAIDGALGVRILKRFDDRRPDYAAVPPITFASLQMMRSALQHGKAPHPEVLLFGEAEQHVAVLRPLKKTDDDAVIGFVLVGLDVQGLIDTVARAQLPSGYIELAQGSGSNARVLGRKGAVASRQGVPTLTVPVEGSDMRVSLWTQRAAPAQDGEAELPVMMMVAVAVLVCGALAGMIVVRRRKAKAKTSGRNTASKSPAARGVEDRPGKAGHDIAVPSGDGLDVHEGDGEVGGPSNEIFRAYDVRGVVGETLTLDVVKQLGLAIGSEAHDRGQQTLCVARDGRASSPELTVALIEGLRESGRDVIDVGEVPTPVLYFSTYYLETGSGVMITGSHNPPNYNGLKIMLGGDTLFGDDIQALKQRIVNADFTTGAGNSQAMDISADYIRRVSDDIPVALGNAFKVVVDCGNGVAGNFAPKLIRALGHDVVELFCEVDGNFPNHHPDPSQPENLQDLIAAVHDNDADLGFAFDGDGDRLGVVDSNGKIIWPDMQMMLFARDVLSRNPGAEIVYDVKCTSRLGKVISKLGGKPVMFKTGHSYIKNKLKETGAPLAGEMSGHIFFTERWYGFDDALYAAARMLEILMDFKQRPAEVFSKLPSGVNTPELNVEMKEGENLLFMQSLGDVEFADATVSTIDGLRVDWPDRWGLVRASNTTPSLVLRFEGDDEQTLEQVKDTFRTLLLEKNPNLSLPF